MKFHRLVFLILFTLTISWLFGACGKRVDDDKAQADQETELTEDERITKMLNDAMYRLRHGDKSALYELEFPYQRFETNYDKYLGIGHVQWAEADSLETIRVDSITYFRPESAYVYARVMFEGPSGKESHYDDKLVIYQTDGEWHKPTVSNYARQQEYDAMVKTADSAAAAESESSDM